MSASPRSSNKLVILSVKKQARALQKALRSSGATCTYQACLEEISHRKGYKTYSAMLASVANKSDKNHITSHRRVAKIKHSIPIVFDQIDYLRDLVFAKPEPKIIFFNGHGDDHQIITYPQLVGLSGSPVFDQKTKHLIGLYNPMVILNACRVPLASP